MNIARITRVSVRAMLLIGLAGALYLVACIIIDPAHSAETKGGLTTSQALSMLAALRNLDGRPTIIKQNGVDTVVVTPWDFGSGALRMRIATNVAALAAIETMVENVRQKIVQEILRTMPPGADGKPATTIAQGTPEWDNFQKQIADMLNQQAPVSLSRIRASDLKLDKNEIPVTALAALASIIDDDLPK